MSKKTTKILIVLAIWAAVTWRFREKLLPVPEPDAGPVPAIRHPHHAHEQPSVPTSDPDDLTEVKGVGPVYQGRLSEMGISTFAQLAGADADAIAERLDVAVAAVDDWKRQAGELQG